MGLKKMYRGIPVKLVEGASRCEGCIAHRGEQGCADVGVNELGDGCLYAPFLVWVKDDDIDVNNEADTDHSDLLHKIEVLEAELAQCHKVADENRITVNTLRELQFRLGDAEQRALDAEAELAQCHKALNMIEVDKDGDGFICREGMEEVRKALAGLATLTPSETITMTPTDSQFVADQIGNPPPPSPALVEAVAKYEGMKTGNDTFEIKE